MRTNKSNGPVFYILLAVWVVFTAAAEYFMVTKVFPFTKSFVAYDTIGYRLLILAIPVVVFSLIFLPWCLYARLAHKTGRA